MNSQFARALLGCLATCGLAAPLASAGVVVATFNNVDPSITLNYTLVSPALSGGTQAGRFNWTVVSNSGAPLGGTFKAFCIELTQHVSPGGNYTYTETPLADAPDPDSVFAPMGAAKASQIARLISVYNADGSGTAAERAAAAQVAIWETIFDDSVTTSAGNFSVSNATIAAKADAYLTAQVSAQPVSGLYALTSDTAQDMLVPAPGALSMLGLGGLFAARRRR